MSEIFAESDKQLIKILLVGPREEDYFLIRDILNRDQRMCIDVLDHAHSPGELQDRMDSECYDLLLFQYESSEQMIAEAIRLLRRQGRSMPFLILAEGAQETEIADWVDAGSCEVVSREELGHESFLRTIRYAAGLHRQKQQCKSTEQMLRKLHSAVEQCADMVIITDADGRIEYVNPAFERTTGYPRDEILGATPRVLKSGEHSADFYRDVWKTLTAGEVYRGVFINRKKTGETLVIEKTITPVRDNNGKITNYISNDRDISERRHLETTLFQAQKMDAIGQLAGGVAHDFNNLLTVISSYAELMLDEVQSSRARRHLGEIQGAARRAAELTRQLLAFGRKQSQRLQVLDLNQVLRDIARTLPRLIGEDIDVRFVPGPEIGRVQLDPVQIEQVVMNLASNSRDAMPAGGTLTLKTSAVELNEEFAQNHRFVPPGKYVLLEVSDSGTGIANEHLPHVFEPFYTTKAQGKGTGLGLATVYGIVKQNAGFVWVDSELNCGTTFRLYFPEVRQPVSKGTAIEHPRQTDSGGWETIFIVEDEPAVRQATAEFLRTAGYKVLEAENGQLAEQVLASYHEPVHLLITDVVMPVMSGSELADRLPQFHPETRVLFVSGYAESTVKNHRIVDLQENFLQKPFSLRNLAAKVREILSASTPSCAN